MTTRRREQSVFKQQESRELSPVKRRQLISPDAWKKHRIAVNFDNSWKGTCADGERGEGKVHVVKKRTVKHCKLDCCNLTYDILAHARELYAVARKQGINPSRRWINSYVRPMVCKLTDNNIWSNHVRLNTKAEPVSYTHLTLPTILRV